MNPLRRYLPTNRENAELELGNLEWVTLGLDRWRLLLMVIGGQAGVLQGEPLLTNVVGCCAS